MQAKDKIVIDTSDDAKLEEYFSRKAPGDTCSGTFTATLDEAGSGMAILSLTDIQLRQAEPEPVAAEPPVEPAPAKAKTAVEAMYEDEA